MSTAQSTTRTFNVQRTSCGFCFTLLTLVLVSALENDSGNRFWKLFCTFLPAACVHDPFNWPLWDRVIQALRLPPFFFQSAAGTNATSSSGKRCPAAGATAAALSGRTAAGTTRTPAWSQVCSHTANARWFSVWAWVYFFS